MLERIESGITIPRVQCSSVKCKMNILRRQGAEMWWCFLWGSQWKVMHDLLCVLKWAYVKSARDKRLSTLYDNYIFFFSSRNCDPAPVNVFWKCVLLTWNWIAFLFPLAWGKSRCCYEMRMSVSLLMSCLWPVQSRQRFPKHTHIFISWWEPGISSKLRTNYTLNLAAF